MFIQKSAEPIFPTWIWIHDVDPALTGPMNGRLSEALDRMLRPWPTLPRGRNLQTDQVLHELPEFAELTEIMLAAADSAMEAMAAEHDGFCITGCWANINPKGAFHMPHHHPNNFLSGVYYLKTQAGADSITFHDPRPAVETIAPHFRAINRFNALEHAIPVKTGRLVLFPAWLVHSVRANTSDEVRISISFNIQFTDFEKTIARPRWKGVPLDRKPASGRRRRHLMASLG